MLAVDEGGDFRVGQDQREIGGDFGSADRAQRRFDVFRHALDSRAAANLWQ